MSDEQINSAEQEAEEILKAAWEASQPEADCPLGEECPVHHRVDEEYLLNEAEYGRMISYVGDFVVVTEDNHEFDNPLVLVKLLLGGLDQSEAPPRFETTIILVGDGALADLTSMSNREQRSLIRYAATHDDWGNFKSFHEVTVSALKQGMIDVSKPIYPED